MSHQACVGALEYKRDITKKYLGTDDPEKVSEMFSTSDKILETGRKLKQASGGKAKLFPGIDDLMRMYLGARNYAWVEDGKLVIDSKYVYYCTCNNIFRVYIYIWCNNCKFDTGGKTMEKK